MATNKSYTDIEQSKRLIEILPLESADMARCGGENVIMTDYMSAKKKFSVCGELTITPCWSLAALINILPRFIKFKGDNYYLRFMKEYAEYANDEVSITGRCLHTTGNDNLVDACFEMIIKLHELNLL